MFGCAVITYTQLDLWDNEQVVSNLKAKIDFQNGKRYVGSSHLEELSGCVSNNMLFRYFQHFSGPPDCC